MRPSIQLPGVSGVDGKLCHNTTVMSSLQSVPELPSTWSTPQFEHGCHTWENLLRYFNNWCPWFWSRKLKNGHTGYSKLGNVHTNSGFSILLVSNQKLVQDRRTDGRTGKTHNVSHTLYKGHIKLYLAKNHRIYYYNIQVTLNKLKK